MPSSACLLSWLFGGIVRSIWITSSWTTVSSAAITHSYCMKHVNPEISRRYNESAWASILKRAWDAVASENDLALYMVQLTTLATHVEKLLLQSSHDIQLKECAAHDLCFFLATKSQARALAHSQNVDVQNIVEDVQAMPAPLKVLPSLSREMENHRSHMQALYVIQVELFPGSVSSREEARDMAASWQNAITDTLPGSLVSFISESINVVMVSHVRFAEMSIVLDIVAAKYEAFVLDLKPQNFVSYPVTSAAAGRLNGDVVGITQNGNASQTFLTHVGLNGSGEVVGIADTGLDDQSCFFNGANSSLPRNRSANRALRKVIQYIAFADGIAGPRDHGTHVAGTVAGLSNTDNHDYDGMAPGAKIHFFDIAIAGQSALLVPNNLAIDLFPPAKEAGAAIHTNCWSAASNGYTHAARDVDEYSWLNEEFVIVAQAGDAGALGGNTVYSPGTAKNCITVGASLSGKTGSIEDIAPFSSMGPASDGRIKPDVVAPGVSVISAASKRTCGLAEASGTSMASALVAGSVALVRQYFREGWYPSGSPNVSDAFIPSGALLKAMIIHAGRELSGNTSGVSSVPSHVQGFGRVDLHSVLQLGSAQLDRGSLWVHSSQVGRTRVELTQAREYQHTFVVDINGTFKATLVWMDAPASLISRTNLVNDLDLRVLAEGAVYYPNGNAQPDTLNNVEMIEITNATPGNYTVIVAGTAIRSLPQQPNQLPAQPFALVVTFPSTTTTTTSTTTTSTTTTSTTTTLPLTSSTSTTILIPSNESFAKFTSGTCALNGMTPITDIATCQFAAAALRLPATVGTVTLATPRPEGCYYSGNLFFSVNVANIGNGANAGFDVLCSMSNSTSTQVPYRSTEDSSDFWQGALANQSILVVCCSSVLFLLLCGVVVCIVRKRKAKYSEKRFEV